MLTPEKIQQLKEEAFESLALEQDAKEEYIFSTEYFMSVLPSWRRWYLKKNQPHNYIRITRLIPPIDGAVSNPSFWLCYIQVWRRRKNQKTARMVWQYRISGQTFNHFIEMPGWEVQENGPSTHAYLRTQNK